MVPGLEAMAGMGTVETTPLSVPSRRTWHRTPMPAFDHLCALRYLAAPPFLAPQMCAVADVGHGYRAFLSFYQTVSALDAALEGADAGPA